MSIRKTTLSYTGQPRPAPSWARILPFAIYLVFIVIADMLGRMGWDSQRLRWLYAVKIAAVVGALVAFRHSYAELAWQSPGWRNGAIAVATGALVFALWIALDADWMQVGSAAGFDPRNETGRIDWLLVAVRIAGAALVVPVMEELFWRSFLLRWIHDADFLRVRPAAVGIKAFAVSVVLFGFEHNLWLAGIVAGAAYTVLYMRSQNLWTAIIAHGVTNGVLGVWVVSTGSWHYW